MATPFTTTTVKTIAAVKTTALGTGRKTTVEATLPHVGIAALLEKLRKAARTIQLKAMATKGIGSPLGEVEFAGGDAEGYHQRFQNGMIYLKPPAGPCYVHGSILDKYLSLGGETGFLGYPTTDELGTPASDGRYNHFERGSIYWSYKTGAREVHGAIRDRWAVLGWEQSWLGFPQSDEFAFVENGRASVFEHGTVYWWPDTGAIDLGNVSVRYKGLYCFGETDEVSESDEPYVVFGTIGVPPGQPSSLRSQVYEDVDAGNERPDNLPIFVGTPGGLALSLTLCEHDEGDPNKYLGQVQQAMDLVGKGVAAGAAALFGPEAAPVLEGAWKSISPTLAEGVNKVLGTDDDIIAKWSTGLTAKQMILLARMPTTAFWGIQYHIESDLLSDGESSYKVYFDIVPA